MKKPKSVSRKELIFKTGRFWTFQSEFFQTWDSQGKGYEQGNGL